MVAGHIVAAVLEDLVVHEGPLGDVPEVFGRALRDLEEVEDVEGRKADPGDEPAVEADVLEERDVEVEHGLEGVVGAVAGGRVPEEREVLGGNGEHQPAEGGGKGASSGDFGRRPVRVE